MSIHNKRPGIQCISINRIHSTSLFVWFMVFNATFNNIFQPYRDNQFIGGGNQSNRWKAPTCHKSLTNFITQCCIEYTSQYTGFELTTLVVIGTDCTCSCKSNYHDRSWQETSWYSMYLLIVHLWNINITIMFCRYDFDFLQSIQPSICLIQSMIIMINVLIPPI